MDTKETKAVEFVGSGFRQVQPGMLLELGDEVREDDGLFHSLPLELIGRPVTDDMLARRISVHPPGGY